MGKLRNELRGDIRRVMANLDQRWVEAGSHEVCQRLNTLCLDLEPTIEHVLCWVAFFPGEIDLSLFIGAQLGRRAIYLPRISPDYTMQFISIGANWSTEMETGYRGIPAPRDRSGEAYDHTAAPTTAVLVPGIAFDHLGGRLGRGGGYYDRFLAHPAMREAVKIGVCWSLQVVKYVPAEAHDVRMDWICSEREAMRMDDALSK